MEETAATQGGFWSAVASVLIVNALLLALV
jgi:hypothetical protein